MSGNGSQEKARELEVFVEAHADFAKVALELMLDAELPIAKRAPLVAAAQYAYDDFDLIHDKVPAYGLIDDLFVLAVGVDACLRMGGERAAGFLDAQLDGAPLRDLIERMKVFNDGSFWDFCAQNTRAFFAQTAARLAQNPELADETRDRFTLEMWNLSRQTTKARGELDPDKVEQFLAYYRLESPPRV